MASHPKDEDDERGANLRLAQRHRKIVAGRFQGARVLEPEDASPGVVGQVALRFATSAALVAGCRITVKWPDHGWVLPAAGSAVLRLPHGTPAPALQTCWTPITRLLEFTLQGEGQLPAQTPVVIVLSGVYTPESATSQGEAVVTSYEKLVVRETVPVSTRGGQILDGPCPFAIPKIMPGVITGPRRWLPFSCCPGAVSDVSLAFCVHGAIPTGGRLLLELPADGWAMDEHPRVLARSAVLHNRVLTAVWRREQHALEILLTDVSIPMGASLTLTIAQVTNPSKESMTTTTARLTTLSSSGGVIDGPCKLDVARISELRESDFDLVKKAMEELDPDAKGTIPMDQVPLVLRSAGLRLSDELYQSLVLPHLPLYAPKEDSADQAEPADAVAAASDHPATPACVARDALLNMFAVVYAPAYKYGQELRLACGRGQLLQVQEWLARGCDPTARDGSGWCALHYAAEFGHTEVIDVLVNGSSRGDLQGGGDDSEAQSPAEALSLFSIDLNARDTSGWTPLICAAANGHTATVQRLLALGADLSLVSVDGRSALHWAAIRGMDVTVDVVLRATPAAVIDLQDSNGWSALHCATLHANAQCIASLVAHGASTALLDTLKYPPAHYAVATGLAALADGSPVAC